MTAFRHVFLPLSHTVVLIAAVGASLSACTTYRPAPLDPAFTAQAFQDRRASWPAGRIMSEAEALELALVNTPSVHQAKAAYASAVAASRTARVGSAWTLTLTAEYSRQADPQHPWLFGGAIDVPVDAGARRDARLDSADLAVLKARYDVAEAVWTVRTALRRALLDRTVARQEIALASAQVALREQRVAAMERRVAIGEDGRPVALAAQSDHALARQRLTTTQGAEAQATAALAAALGLPVEAVAGLEVTVDPAMEFPTPAELRGARLDAATARADVLKAVIDYDLAEQAVRQAVAGQYPQVTLSPGYTWERGVAKLPFNLGLALPPPDLNRAAIREAEARRAEAGKALESAQAAVYAQTDAAVEALRAADDSLIQLRTRDLPLAQRSERLTQRAVQLGELDRMDLIAAQAGVLDARLAEIDAMRLRAAAIADLEAAIRRPADPAELIVIANAMASLDASS